MRGSVFIWFAATRPEAGCPLPSPLVSLNQGRCAGAFACVRTHTWCLPASALIASIISRALLDRPAGAFFCVLAAAAVLAYFSCRMGSLALFASEILCPKRECPIQGLIGSGN